MPDEAHALLEPAELDERVADRQHVAPSCGRPRRGVHQPRPAPRPVVGQRFEPCAVAGGEGGAGPARCGRSVLVEAAERELPDRRQVVVADHGLLEARLQPLDAFVRRCAVADEVAEANDAGRLHAVEIGQHGFEGLEVPMEVGEDRMHHRTS